MANTINNAFITQFETEVHLAYQRMGSKLRNTVRQASNVTGSTAKFQVIGKGTAATPKAAMQTLLQCLIWQVAIVCCTTVTATLTDHYAPEYIDKLDELKINIDERQAVAQSAAYALGRKTDELIYAAMDAVDNGTTINADATGALVKADLLTCLKLLVLPTSLRMAVVTLP